MGSSTYHLWLMPQQASSVFFATVIGRLSNEYQTRLFEPHVTLAGNITGPENDLLARTKMLAAQLTPFTLTPVDIQYLNEFYQSLFLVVTLSESLVQANNEAKQRFGLPQGESYMPHLSLLYGDLPVTEKEKIKEELKEQDPGLLDQFMVDRIILLRTDDQSDVWTAVKSFPL